MSDLRRDIAEWVAYLRDVGVTELNVAPRAERERRRPRAATTGAAGRGAAAPRAEVSEARAAKGGAATALEAIREEIGECTRCKLHEGRTKLVFGVGDPDARLMFVGEGPGEQEDLQGEPFVGAAGQKLNEMIKAIGLERSRVYIANIVKCRPPKNREPEPDEVETCSPFLARQIAAIRPRVIVTLGGPATKTLLGTRTGITRLRGTWQRYGDIDVMPTFHPAYVLRNYTRETRMQVWEDLKAAKARSEEA